MSTRVACARPQGCRVQWHVAGTAAAIACAGAALRQQAVEDLVATELAPYALAERCADGADVVQWLQDRFDAEDAACGWSAGSGRPHPTGGCTQRLVRLGAKSQITTVTHYDPDGFTMHREDGPSRLAYSSDGTVRWATWMVGGTAHRADGPAVVETGNESRAACATFVLRPSGASGPSSDDDDDDGWTEMTGPAASAHFAALRASGYTAAEAVSWMSVGHALDDAEADPETVAGLADRGVTPERALEVARAGVSDLETLTAVALGEMPLSWALAGR